jgi:hypothetical protein
MDDRRNGHHQPPAPDIRPLWIGSFRHCTHPGTHANHPIIVGGRLVHGDDAGINFVPPTRDGPCCSNPYGWCAGSPFRDDHEER